MAGATLGHERVGEREQQGRVAVCVLEQSRALHVVGVAHAVELVAQREVDAPLYKYVEGVDRG